MAGKRSGVPRPEVLTLPALRTAAATFSAWDDPSRVAAFERSVRLRRARQESFTLTALDEGPAFAVSGASGGTYVVDVPTLGEDPSCTCPDFFGNRLGTCKHVEAVRRAREEHPDLAAPRRRGPKATLTVRGDGDLRLVLVGDRAALGLLPSAAVVGDAVVAPPDALPAPGTKHGLRVTHAAVSAAKVLAERRARAARTAELSCTMQGVTLDAVSVPLFPYQRDGVRHLVTAGRAVLADDMGLGKTVQAIAACEVLRRRGEARRVLVVCPSSLKAQWAGEIERLTGERAVVVAGGRAARRRALSTDAAYAVLNYELTWRELGQLDAFDADVIVLDEAQRARNFRSKTAATLHRMTSRFLFVLTGTPVENRLDDLYGLLQLVDAEILGPLWKFNVDFHVRDEHGKIRGYRDMSALRARIAPLVLRRRKDEVLAQLPALTEQTRYVAMSEAQVALEEGHRKKAAMLLAAAKRRALAPAEQKRLQAALTKARLACNAACLATDGEGPDGSAKLDEFVALVSEVAAQGSSKVLVFSEWTRMLALAGARLDGLGIGYETLHGGIPEQRRPELLDRFRNDPSRVVLLATDAGGVGLNLQVASYVVHLDLPWNPARLDQRTARAHRIGQTHGVSVTYLVSETGIERGIEATLHGKRSVHAAAVDAGSDVDALDVPSFVLLAKAIGVEEEPPAAPTAPAPRAAEVVKGPSVEVDGFVWQRLRLAQVVLDADFPGDAVRAAYDAVAALLRARLAGPVPEGHVALVDALYRELVPSGLLPTTTLGILAKIHDLAALAEAGEPVERAAAEAVVEEARGLAQRKA